MRRPSLFRFSSSWLLGGFLTLVLLAVVLAVVNAVDYLPFGIALRRMQHLDEAGLRALAEACTRYEKAGHLRLAGDAIPPEFRALKPVRVSFYPGSSDITLLERGDSLYVFLRVSTNLENQIVEGVSCGLGPQRQRRLWERNPEFTRRLQPVDRVLTVRQGSMSHSMEWVVRPEELLVIDRPGTVGGTDEIVARIPLTSAQLEPIEAGARAISAESRGHLYDGGALDGTWLGVSFTADGSHRDDDFGMANTWRDEAGPLLDSINQLVGKDKQITFRERVTDHFRGGAVVQEAFTWQEAERRRNWIPPIPWWCLWPRLGFAEK